MSTAVMPYSPSRAGLWTPLALVRVGTPSGTNGDQLLDPGAGRLHPFDAGGAGGDDC